MARNNENTKLLEVMEILEPEPNSLRYKRFCITGHMARTRDVIETMIVKAGGQVESNVKYANFLVTNADWNANIKVSSKFKKAQELGIQIISEADLYTMMMPKDL